MRDTAMLLETLVEKCDKRHKEKANTCENCTYEEYCDANCEKCLEYVHFPDKASQKRKYDCPSMADFYFCKYSYRYMSELIYALKNFKDVKDKEELNVISIGCGPCTELCALDFLKEKGVYQYKSIEFIGVDALKGVWKNIHRDIKELYGDQVKFYYNDALGAFSEPIENKWIPDIVVFQYVFSDMFKNYQKDRIDAFIRNLADFFKIQIKSRILLQMILILQSGKKVEGDFLMI